MFNRGSKHTILPELDRDGYLVDTQKWTKEVAEILAKTEMPQGLSEDHWRVIDFMRQYYLEWESAPPVRMLARETGLTLRDLKQMFPNGLAKCACRFAGLPLRVITRYP
ncbi:TusE/DsrC/DsvC family sulfur relay protein [Chloroflexota bacterium]